MRIHYLWGGKLPSELANSVHVMKMCEGMATLGHEVTLFHSSAHPPAWIDERGLLEQYAIRRRFSLFWLPSRAGLQRHLFGFHAARHVLMEPAAQLVYSRFLPAAAWSAMFGVPTVHELHVPPATVSERTYLRLLLRSRGFRKLIVITQALQHEIRNFVPEHRWPDIEVEPDGVNLEEYQRAAGPAPPDIAAYADLHPLVGYVGSLHAGKGAELILPIAKLSPKAQFIVVGGPDEIAEEYRRRTAAERIANVAWLGFRTNSVVPAYVRACDVLLLPNQREIVLRGRQDIGRWTSPLKMFEYMAAGKIIISSNLPVLTEVLNRNNAVLCDPADPGQWAEEVMKIASGKCDYSSRAARARQDAQHYGWKERAARRIAAAGVAVGDASSDGSPI